MDKRATLRRNGGRACPFAHRHPSGNRLSGAEIRTALTDPVQANIIATDPRKQTSGGRHQIGTLAGFKSESVAGFISECLAGFVGIRKIAPNEVISIADGYIFDGFCDLAKHPGA